jgi:hypothetical protein
MGAGASVSGAVEDLLAATSDCGSGAVLAGFGAVALEASDVPGAGPVLVGGGVELVVFGGAAADFFGTGAGAGAARVTVPLSEKLLSCGGPTIAP